MGIIGRTDGSASIRFEAIGPFNPGCLEFRVRRRVWSSFASSNRRPIPSLCPTCLSLGLIDGQPPETYSKMRYICIGDYTLSRKGDHWKRNLGGIRKLDVDSRQLDRAWLAGIKTNPENWEGVIHSD